MHAPLIRRSLVPSHLMGMLVPQGTGPCSGRWCRVITSVHARTERHRVAVCFDHFWSSSYSCHGRVVRLLNPRRWVRSPILNNPSLHQRSNAHLHPNNPPHIARQRCVDRVSVRMSILVGRRYPVLYVRLEYSQMKYVYLNRVLNVLICR